MTRAAIVQDIRAASRELVRELGFLDKTLAGTDLSPSSVHAVLEIGLTPGLTAKALSERLRLKKSTVSRLLKSLKSRGEILQTPSPTDGRALVLSLTTAGKRTFNAIDMFGNMRVEGALSRIASCKAETISQCFAEYAQALRNPPVPESGADRGADCGALHDAKAITAAGHAIVEGYQTGMIGDVAALHARTHGPIVGMGPTFESVVSEAMTEFMTRLEKPINNSWNVVEDGRVIGSISIDGEDLGNNLAHLRWFILSEQLRGKGLGKILLSRALDHCDAHGFTEVHLWTLKGLDAARYLYERSGFKLVDEYVGDQWGNAVTEQKFVRQRP